MAENTLPLDENQRPTQRRRAADVESKSDSAMSRFPRQDLARHPRGRYSDS